MLCAWCHENSIRRGSRYCCVRCFVLDHIERDLPKGVGVDGCWLWTGGKNRNQYGVVRDGGRVVPVHRWMYEQFHGEIPEGHYVTQTCGNRLCCCPEHLTSQKSFAGKVLNLKRLRMRLEEDEEFAPRWGTEVDEREVRQHG